MNSGIYCIENLVNGKKYIGQAIDFKKRWKKHKWEIVHDSHHNDYFANAVNKYGIDNFKFWIVEELEPDIDKLNLMEIYWIAYFNAYWEDGGYNLTRGGDGTFGGRWKWPEDAKLARSGSCNPMCGMSGSMAPNFGKLRSEESKIKTSNSIKKWWAERKLANQANTN